MGDNDPQTMREALKTKVGCPGEILSYNPLTDSVDHDYKYFVTVEEVRVLNGNIIFPVLPWSMRYELYGLKNLTTDFFDVFQAGASSPKSNLDSRILGIIPTIGFPLLKSRPVIVETPWFIAKVKFKGEGTVTSPESKIKKAKFTPAEHSLELESDDIKDHINSSFEIDTKKLALPVPKFSIKNTFMNGMEISAGLKVEPVTPQLLKITANSNISSPSFKVYNGLYVTLAFGFEAEIYVRKSDRNNKDNPFNGIELPASIPLGKPLFMDNVSQNISQQWKDLISLPDFRVKQNSVWDFTTSFQHGANYDRLKSKNSVWSNTISAQHGTNISTSSQLSNIVWHQDRNAQSQNTNHRYLRTIVMDKNTVHTPYKPDHHIIRDVGTTTKLLPFLYDAAEGLGVTIIDNPELILLLF